VNTTGRNEVKAGQSRNLDDIRMHESMKTPLLLTTIALAATVLFTGCLAFQVGGGDKKEGQKPTVGQQLIDLKAAKDQGAISESDYQAQKAKLLSGN
jgi:hypothetical protein